MADIIVIGSIYIDLVANVIDIPKKGETVIGTSFNQLPGGRGTNQAITMANLGGNVAMVGKIGDDDLGNKLVSQMESYGINTYYIEKTKEAPTGVSLISVDREGEDATIVASGANTKINNRNIDKADDIIEKSKIVVTQLEIPIETVKYGLKKAKTKGKYTILDPTPAQVLDCEIIRHVDLLIADKLKLEVLSGISINNEKDLKKAAEILLGLGVKELIVFLREKGCIYINSSESKNFNSYETSELNITNANNIFNSALTFKLSQGESMDESINYALEKVRG
ncbi:MAG TPA: ribokinase [Tissierellales bacterium]|nr:ribokinase [Tissierellales bacterium]